jgi:phosphoribosylformylglycinamidine cyclo-ligase
MLTYRDSGVDIDAGNELVNRIKGFTKGIGGFAGMVPIDSERMLVASTDGVGTKLAIAIEMQRYDTIGQDLVAMCVNDLVTVGARPLFFLDYYATSKLDVDQAEAVVRGIAQACDQVGCALLGGETAEMPGFYQPGTFDLAGFTVGMVARDRVIDGRTVQEDDVLVGLPSSGVHSNGFSLVRRILADRGLSLSMPFDGRTLGDSLLEPTALYVKPVLDLLDRVPVKGMAHITGGGFENIQRFIPDGLTFLVSEGAWEIPEVFQLLQREGRISDEEMRRTFNMGIGMALCVATDQVAGVLSAVPGAFEFGEIIRG